MMFHRFRTRAELLRVTEMSATLYEHALKQGLLVPARPAPTPADVHLFDHHQVLRWAAINRLVQFGMRLKDAASLVPPLVGYFRDDRAVLVIRQDRANVHHDGRLVLEEAIVPPGDDDRVLRESGDVVLRLDLAAIQGRVEAALEAQG